MTAAVSMCVWLIFPQLRARAQVAATQPGRVQATTQPAVKFAASPATQAVAKPAVAAAVPPRVVQPSVQPSGERSGQPPVQAAAQPAAHPVDCTTPMALLNSYDGLAGEDPPAYLSLYELTDDDDVQRLAHVQAKFDAQVGMLQKIVQEKWGDDGVDQTLHALGLKTRRDIESSAIKQMGRHARVIYSDGTPGPDLLKTKAGWRVSIPGFRDSLGMPVDDYLKQLHQLSNLLPDVADAIVDGRLASPSAVVSDIARRINASTNP
jgi:hypothetical protein